MDCRSEAERREEVEREQGRGRWEEWSLEFRVTM